MNTLNLFLENAKGEDVEAVHQRILGWLFHSKTVVREVFEEEVSNPKVGMETSNKTYDLQIDSKDKEPLLIELKMWSTLDDRQIKKQITNKRKGRLIYILFGISYLERKDFLEDNTQPILKGTEIKVIGAEYLSKSLLKLSDKTNSIVEELNSDTEFECTSIELKNFLRTYALRLFRVNDWLLNEAWKPEGKAKNETAHFASLFNQVKIGLTKNNAYKTFLYRSGQSAVKLEITSPEVRLKKDGVLVRNREVVIEGMPGKLVFWLENNSIKIFFFLDNLPKEIVNPHKVIRKKFQEIFDRKIFEEGNSLGEVGTTKYLGLWSKTLKEIAPEEIINQVEIYFPYYVDAYKKLLDENKS